MTPPTRPTRLRRLTAPRWAAILASGCVALLIGWQALVLIAELTDSGSPNFTDEKCVQAATPIVQAAVVDQFPDRLNDLPPDIACDVFDENKALVRFRWKNFRGIDAVNALVSRGWNRINQGPPPLWEVNGLPPSGQEIDINNGYPTDSVRLEARLNGTHVLAVLDREGLSVEVDGDDLARRASTQ